MLSRHEEGRRLETRGKQTDRVGLFGSALIYPPSSPLAAPEGIRFRGGTGSAPLLLAVARARTVLAGGQAQLMHAPRRLGPLQSPLSLLPLLPALARLLRPAPWLETRDSEKLSFRLWSLVVQSSKGAWESERVRAARSGARAARDGRVPERFCERRLLRAGAAETQTRTRLHGQFLFPVLGKEGRKWGIMRRRRKRNQNKSPWLRQESVWGRTVAHCTSSITRLVSITCPMAIGSWHHYCFCRLPKVQTPSTRAARNFFTHKGSMG